MSLVDPGSDDFNLAKAVLDQLQSRAAARAQQATSTNLNPPQPPAVDDLDPPIDLPVEAIPPTPVPTPLPTEEPAETPEPTPTPTPLP